MSESTSLLRSVMREHGDALLGRAVLLTGDRAAAAALVETALAAALGRGTAPATVGEAADEVRKEVHRAFLRTRGDEPPLESREDLDDAAPEETHDIRAALRALSRRQRVVTVSRFSDGKAASAIARDTGIAPAKVRLELERGAATLARLRPDLRIDVDDAVDGGVDEEFTLELGGAR